MTYPPQGSQPPHGQHPQQPYGRTPHVPQGHLPQQQPYGDYQPRLGYPPPPPPPRKNNTGLIIMLVIGIPLLLLGSCVATVTALGSNTTTIADERLRSAPDQAQPADTSAPAATTQTTQPTEVQQSQEPPTEQGQVAKVGETITVKGREPGVQVAVTLNRVIDNATSNNQFLQPDAGTRYVAVELTLKNVGQQVYTDSPMFGADLIDAEGQQHRTTLAPITEGVSFSGSITVSPGDSRKGVIVFTVPSSAKPAKLQFGVMFQQQKGEWQLD
ncbi:hypothetical protein Misp01_79190 [Microtetraspora sp. NBRC 13810]|uniref:DUF4352 domain-containing protein n=1 Tax=Microtetraspora sp. NBRC 13810 TaxID=3030990 RepID=UPI0024A0FB6A|nr:DUF4352 domain-containing protein [Microtetraspora sp. NBRC 13810]GLW12791.1 hypothetical protein Misp01_79190 [Microtetraspora sp. NBRC 13810]